MSQEAGGTEGSTRTVTLTAEAFEAVRDLIQVARLDGWMLPVEITDEINAAFGNDA